MLISKGMSNICLKVTTEKNLTFSKLRLSKFKNFLCSQFLGGSNLRRYHCILELLVAT